MASSRIVSVFGATGRQGGSVIRAILKDGTFTPRAITRNPEAEGAQSLKALGVEVVKGDTLDKASLVSALRGSEGVFGVTVAILPLEAEGEGPNEVMQGKNMVDAAKAAGVKFFVFSSLPSLFKRSNGKYKNALQYDQKADVEEYLKTSGLANASIHLGFFLENFWKFGFLKKTPTGFVLGIPNTEITVRQDFTWAERDVGTVVLALLKNYTDASKGISGKTYPIVNAYLPYTELVERIGNALGEKVTFARVKPPGGGMIHANEMWEAQTEYNGILSQTPFPNPDLVALGVNLATLEDFLEAEIKPRFGQ
ncbi:hypothetical protein C8R43DRAFT_1124085 [Mycena crocata]|nr:hypothetical protein C8R43DRAFT_1124085 [Mycena crocata]